MKTLSALWLGVLLAAGCSNSREELVKELTDPKPVVRSGAVRSLASEGDEEAYLFLGRAMQDHSVVVRIAAVQTAAKFPKHDPTAMLVRATHDADPEVREAALDVLVKRGGETGKKALIDMLVAGETNLQVRKKLYEALAKMGLSGEGLASDMAAAQIGMIRSRYEEARSVDRAQLVTMAGRSIHPDGVEVVLRGLSDQDPDVVLTSLSVLDGRGGAKALARLQVLAADQVERIRLMAIREAARFGAQGAPILQGAMRDSAPGVRLAAIAQLEALAGELHGEDLCPMLTDSDGAVAVRAAEAARSLKIDCGLGQLKEELKDSSSPRYDGAIQVLSAIGNDKALARLEAEMKMQPASLQPLLASALVQAGERRPELARLLKQEFSRSVSEYLLFSASWVNGKIPARPKKPEALDKKLNDADLDKLHSKYGLPPAGQNAPRGVADILKDFPEQEQDPRAYKLFTPCTRQELDRLTMLLEGLLAIDPIAAAPGVARMLKEGSPEVVGRVAATVHSHRLSVALDEATLSHLGEVLKKTGVEDSTAIAELLVAAKDPAVVPALAGGLEKASWEKRERLIGALAKLGHRDGIPVLLTLLKGYSAGVAAAALAQIGDSSVVEPLKKLLESAGPSEELEILMALARLGNREILPHLIDKLNESEPEVRRAAVRILGVLGGNEAGDALQAVRFDLDRLVRREVESALAAPKVLENPDDRQQKKVEGRGGATAPEGPVRKSPRVVPEGPGAKP